jgi:hypothetical protein
LLLAVNLILAAAIAGSIAAALAPLEQAAPARPAVGAQPASAPSPQERLGPLESYAPIYENDLRRPLRDTPASQAAAPTVAPPPIRLTGTAMEAGSSFGIFRTSTNEVKLAGVGETVEGAEITEITANAATVKYNGQTFTLRVREEGAKP